ncbi:aspartyl-phosphate phosphatase Spo0E family protein [Paenibacillus sp. sptzw28]|uniref:aspartyl-phosphate phosphatase Spo0E family protein n=1 Tax=Paenibacillus sp. sptzw28 TaxID=715179 RepID=UPI001C6E0E6B|nr:aspartyl-phosphate phosphatase Spo0E family protein [Paenibacillus sp. sptzw28]
MARREEVVSGSAEQILVAVERLREELHATVNAYGRISTKVLLKSQELDDLLNRYNDLVKDPDVLV